jgi:hypothetical protein
VSSVDRLAGVFGGGARRGIDWFARRRIENFD